MSRFWLDEHMKYPYQIGIGAVQIVDPSFVLTYSLRSPSSQER
ncbi:MULTISPECIES: hypothetical protein [unclassified Leptolyngbya]|nr:MULTISPECIES: hypothetical protein [unclassified Leptolyngbya]